jgi:hypothetical protein
MTIDEALAYFGNGLKMAKALGVGSNTISNWRSRGNVIPLLVQWQIELGTKGELKADERPFVLGLKEIKEAAKIPNWARQAA